MKTTRSIVLNKMSPLTENLILLIGNMMIPVSLLVIQHKVMVISIDDSVFVDI